MSSEGSSSATLHSEAGPLPSKRGEIGFVEGLHVQQDGSSASTVDLPERHPADYDAPPTFTASTPSLGTTSNPLPSVPAGVSPSSSSTDIPSSNNSVRKKRILHFLKSEEAAVGGFRLITLFAFMAQLLIFGGSIAAWALTTKHLSSMAANSNSTTLMGGSSQVFIHVVFVIAVLGQLLFLERRLFRLRAERYSHVHPGEVLPRYGNSGGGGNTVIGFAPWSRPPLPTYAAALAQSGLGTGDVEDNAIAVPPPPAYGNTRGSTLLLAGFLRESLRAQRPVSVRSEASDHRERPLSYASKDEEWEEVQNAERARQLEETLAQLQRPGSRGLHNV